MRASGMAGSARRFGLRHRTVVAMLGGSLAVLPVAVVSGAAVWWLDPPATPRTLAMPLVGGYQPELSRVSVDGSLPEPPNPEELRIYEMPEVGPLGIPKTALDAYKRAARRMGDEQPGCNLDWALLASIGRIESGHARGGYVDAEGTTREPILGPVLNGQGPVASISDTDGGEHDGDRTWDRAVGPMQFIPSTWARWGADGNDDGLADPHNIYDATVAAGRYLCSGGVDLADSGQLRAAIFRYNNSTSYVETVVRWAEAYRSGVLSVPDSEVPRAVPEVLTVDRPSADDPAAGAQLPSRSPSPDSTPSDSPEATRPDAPSEKPSEGEPEEPSDPPEDEPEEPSDPPEGEPEEPSDPPEGEPEEPNDPPEGEPEEPSDPPEDEPEEPNDPPEGEPEEPSDPPEDEPDGSTDPTEPCEPEDGSSDEGETGDEEETSDEEEISDEEETSDSESAPSPEPESPESPESCDDGESEQQPTDATTTGTAGTNNAGRRHTPAAESSTTP